MALPLAMPPEELRALHRPEHVKYLFVGESRPANGTFFYAANSLLFHAVQQAFTEACGPGAGEGRHFLAYFMHTGSFLIDLCPGPVNHLTQPDRALARDAGIPALAETLSSMQPTAIICVMQGIHAHVEAAMADANLGHLPARFLPFPAMGHQPRFRHELVQAIAQFHVCA